MGVGLAPKQRGDLLVVGLQLVTGLGLGPWLLLEPSRRSVLLSLWSLLLHRPVLLCVLGSLSRAFAQDCLFSNTFV